MNSLKCVAIAAAIGLAACGGPPASGGPAGPAEVSRAAPNQVEGAYSGTMFVEGSGFTGRMQLQTERGGVVRGTFEISQPMQASGVVEGTVVGDQLSLTVRYSNNPMTGCDGSVAGTLVVSDGGSLLVGPVTVTDCGEPLRGSMRFAQAPR